MPDPSGKTVVKEIGGFRLIRQLGEGGMGKVFLAQQQSLSRRVALKVLPPDMAQDQEFLARFHREAQSAAMFQHANVVNVFSAGQDPHCGVHYIAFELVEGGSLEDLLKEQPKLPEERALYIARGIAQALAYAESKELVHRDVKPDNILLDPEGNPKLADLGLAKQPRLETAQVTQTGMVLGTPLYMAPEQALGVNDLDIRADIYALGLCLWRMLTGLMPFDENNSNSSLQILTKHINEDLPDVRERASEVSEGAARVTAWMSARERDDRYRSAKSLARDLDLVLMGEPPLGPAAPDLSGGLGETVAMPSGPIRAASSRRARATSGRPSTASAGPRLSRPTIAGVLVGALGVGIGLAVAFSGSAPPEAKTASVERAAPPPPVASDPSPAPTRATPPRKTEQPVDHAADPPPPPPPTVDPSPAATTRPEPKPTLEPKPEPTSTSKPADALARVLDTYRTVYFGALHQVREPQQNLIRGLQTLPPEPRRRIKASLRIAGALLKPEPDRRALARTISAARRSDVDAPLPGALGSSFTGWLLELERLNTILIGVEAHLRDPSAARDLKLYKWLNDQLDPEAREAFSRVREDRDAGPPRRGGLRPRPRAWPPEERLQERIRDRASALLRSLRTPEQRLRGHAQLVALLLVVVNGIDRWEETGFFQKLGVGFIQALLLQNPDVRRTAICAALREPLDEIRMVSSLLKTLPSSRAVAEAYVRRSTKASAFLHTRVRPPGPREPAPRAVLLLEPRGKVVVGFGRASVTLRTGSVKARGKTRVKCRRWRKEGTQLFLRPHSGTKLEVDQLNEKGAQLDVVLNDKVSPAARLRIRGEAGRILVIPRIGPPPAGTQRLRSLMGAPPRQGERRGRRWRRGE